MPDPPDPIDLVRATNPVDEADLPDNNSSEGRRLLAHILSQPRQTSTADRRWRQKVILVAAATLLVAAGWVLLRPVSEPLGLACYAAPDLDADRVAVALGTTLEATACAPLWANRTLTNPEIVAPGVVPELQACVSPSGGLAVFPTVDAQICEQLGLLPPDPASLPEAEAVREMTETLANRIGAKCLSMDQAAEVVDQVLEDSDLGGWTVSTMPTTAERRCASVALDAINRTITLVPIP
jgi:hypothetical protein